MVDVFPSCMKIFHSFAQNPHTFRLFDLLTVTLELLLNSKYKYLTLDSIKAIFAYYIA